MLPDPETVPAIQPDSPALGERLLVDVRTVEAFAGCRIPGSVNHCVYEVAFLEAFPKAYPDREAAIVVYGDGDPFKADLAAVGRLRGLGYTNVAVLAGGLTRWKAAGHVTEGHGSGGTSPVAGTYLLDSARTRVRWVGRNLANQHDGEVAAVRGQLELSDDGMPLAGEVVVDLRQMTCRDIEDRTLAGALIGHLQNADFFDVGNHPEASFRLQAVTPIPDANTGQPNFMIEGTMQARGRSIVLTIPALIEATAEGIVFQSNFNFDRVALGACYGSGRLFERLGMHLVNDLVSIDVAAFFQPRT